jgi:hypothetical protein
MSSAALASIFCTLAKIKPPPGGAKRGVFANRGRSKQAPYARRLAPGAISPLEMTSVCRHAFTSADQIRG